MRIFCSLCFTYTFYYFGYYLPYWNLTDTHLFNDHWPPHARFHLAIFLIMTFNMNLLALVLAWLPSRLGRWPIVLSGLMGLLIMIPNFTAMYFAEHYGGGQHTHDNSQVLFTLNRGILEMLMVLTTHIIGVLMLFFVVRQKPSPTET